MRTLRFLSLPVLLVLALVVAGCGGSSAQSVPQDAVAVVSGTTITKAQFNDLISSAKQSYKANKSAFPKPGTSDYKTLEDKAVTYLVQQAELEQKAKDLGVTVTAKDVQTRIDQLKQQYFKGSEKEYEKQLKAQGLTDAELRKDLHNQILSEKLYDKVTGDLKVSTAQVTAYYNGHKSQYTTQASRDVRHILVASKKKAQDLESQLKGGADFAKLAKKYSTDTQSAKVGGKLTITKGQTVPSFDKVAFSLKTNEISAPVHSQYGWHIIQALGPVKPAKQTPLKDVKEQIRENLLQTKKANAMTKWVDQLQKDYASKVSYQAGYAPAATATTGTGNTTITDTAP